MPKWTRVRSKATGHEFDLRADDSRITDGVVEVVKDYPENEGLTARPRPAKHRISKAGRQVTAEAAQPAEGKKEN